MIECVAVVFDPKEQVRRSEEAVVWQPAVAFDRYVPGKLVAVDLPRGVSVLEMRTRGGIVLWKGEASRELFMSLQPFSFNLQPGEGLLIELRMADMPLVARVTFVVEWDYAAVEKAREQKAEAEAFLVENLPVLQQLVKRAAP